ncbi:transcription elongation factor S-II [Drosophila subpulchrella]|uniref:transcription elongation factor S-II n=1 Tax=Drosophila subpulchrella TaxID=1486046 RepID=UPI0018A139F4|nr:transcription elongation factor S-II [Drosophila subpulchrella]
MSFVLRLKCRELLADALRIGQLTEGCGDPDDMAARLEEVIYEELRCSNVKYKNRIRLLLSNLRDSKNPGLRNKFLRGVVTPSELATMFPEEMENDDLEQIPQKITKKAINQAQMPKVQGTKKDQFKCDSASSCKTKMKTSRWSPW